jgi:peptide subunit release factor RF-3
MISAWQPAQTRQILEFLSNTHQIPILLIMNILDRMSEEPLLFPSNNYAQ